MSTRKKTDSSYLEEKLRIRELAMQGLEEIRVLDIFAGENKMWENVEKQDYYPIEIIKGKGRNVYGDNLKIIPVLDLSRYTLIDCDSYGIPYEQIKQLYENKTLKPGTRIVYTATFSPMSQIPKALARDAKIEDSYRKCQTLYNAHSQEFFYLALKKLTKNDIITMYERGNDAMKKHYGFWEA